MTNALDTKSAPSKIEELMNQDNIKKRFKEVLGKKSAGFISSLIAAYKGNSSLREADPMSVISAGMIAATLDLPINSNLGFAHIVPYSSKGVMLAQFQVGWKGFVQLAIRTGQYKTMNAAVIYEGELKSYNRITGEVEFDLAGKKSDKVIGYVSFFKLINGFEKYLYMPVEETTAHGKKYSKSFNTATGKWKLDFDSMSLKTVVKMLLGKWGILSIELQKAITADQGVSLALDGEDFEYPDAPEATAPERLIAPSIPVKAEVVVDENETYAVNGQITAFKDLAKAAGLSDFDLFEFLEGHSISSFDRIPMSKLEELSAQLKAKAEAKK